VDNDYDKLFSHLKAPEPREGLLDRIISAVQREQELRNTRRLALVFFALLGISLSAAPFTWAFFSGQAAESGILQLVSAVISDFGTFFAIWPDFLMAIAESLPVAGVTALIINMILAVFTLRLFLYKKRLLLGYFIHGMSFV
jgi:hypothetical protein